MSDKSIVIDEKTILEQMNLMAQESLSPDEYDAWADVVMPALKKARSRLQ